MNSLSREQIDDRRTSLTLRVAKALKLGQQATNILQNQNVKMTRQENSLFTIKVGRKKAMNDLELVLAAQIFAFGL